MGLSQTEDLQTRRAFLWQNGTIGQRDPPRPRGIGQSAGQRIPAGGRRGAPRPHGRGVADVDPLFVSLAHDEATIHRTLHVLEEVVLEVERG
jgi:hypothetical protein